MSAVKNEFKDQEQRVAVCMTQWRDRNKRSDDEPVFRTTRAAPSPDQDPLHFVMSDGSSDRSGFVIEPQGWQLDNFRRNPIALFNHRPDFIVGQWQDVRVEGDQLRGRLELMQPVSERQREVHAAARAGVLRTVSVGFHSKRDDVKPIEGGGLRFLKPELVECSLVSVPANPNALAIARSLGLSREARDLIFGVPAFGDRSGAEGIPGKRALDPPPFGRFSVNISERIERTQTRLTALRDELARHLEAHEEMDDQALGIQDELNRRIATVNRELEGYRLSEAALGDTAEPMTQPPTSMEFRNLPVINTGQAAPGRPAVPAMARPFAVPAEKVNPLDAFWRAGAIAMYAHVHKVTPDSVRQMIYGDEPVTKVITDLVTRAATVPADTVTPAWAGVLVQTINAAFMELLLPMSIYPRLSGMGQRYTFGRNGVISIPTREATPTIAGSFVAEGAPIPVRQGAFTSVQLTPKKMAVITAMTREISEHSIPQLEQLLRNAIEEDTAVSIDVILLDNIAASAIRPAGIRNGVAVTPPTAGGGQAAIVGDIGNLSGALLTATNGNIRNPAWLMNPVAANKAALTTTAMGVFPFREEINAGRLNRWPVLESGTVPADMVILIDAADFASVTGDQPRWDVSDQATIHMEDTTPLAISSPGAPNTVAAPVRSLWQTDSLGIRMIMPMNWALRRTGTVAWTQPITW